MNNYKLTISYDGSRYKGWQRLKNSDKTIQGKIEGALSLFTKESIEVIGSGRTDGGVHALGQVANFKSKATLDMDSLKHYLYHCLPEDIIVTEIEEVHERFHARYNAVAKDYVYQINNNLYHNPFNRKYWYHVQDVLDLDRMKDACSYFIGEKDFQSFTSLKNKKKSTVRKINTLSIEEKNGYIHIFYNGNGFLYHMVRIITGTLIEVGKSNLKTSDIPTIFEKNERSYAGPTVPAHGLFLSKVYY